MPEQMTEQKKIELLKERCDELSKKIPFITMAYFIPNFKEFIKLDSIIDFMLAHEYLSKLYIDGGNKDEDVKLELGFIILLIRLKESKIVKPKSLINPTITFNDLQKKYQSYWLMSAQANFELYVLYKEILLKLIHNVDLEYVKKYLENCPPNNDGRLTKFNNGEQQYPTWFCLDFNDLIYYYNGNKELLLNDIENLIQLSKNIKNYLKNEPTSTSADISI